MCSAIHVPNESTSSPVQASREPAGLTAILTAILGFSVHTSGHRGLFIAGVTERGSESSSPGEEMI